MGHHLAELYDNQSNVKLGGFQSLVEASYVSRHIEELWYNCLWMTTYTHIIYIYIYIERERVEGITRGRGIMEDEKFAVGKRKN